MGEQHHHPRIKPGDRLNNLTVHRLIGRGKRTEVYQAYHSELKRDVAVKLFNLPPGHNQDLPRRFHQQVRAISDLRHPNIIRVFESGALSNALFTVTELASGTSLRDELSTRPTGMGKDQVLRIFSQIASAIATAHEGGIVHGNLKPDNILFDSYKRPIVTDFNIPCLRELWSQGDTVLSSATYLAPEQTSPPDATFQSDIYALGVILYEMSTGDVPFKGESADEILRQHKSTIPSPPSTINIALDPRFDHVVLKALQTDPNARFQTVRGMLSALENEAVRNQYETLTLARDSFPHGTKRHSEIMRFERSRVTASPAPPAPNSPAHPAITWKHIVIIVAVALLIAAVLLIAWL